MKLYGIVGLHEDLPLYWPFSPTHRSIACYVYSSYAGCDAYQSTSSASNFIFTVVIWVLVTVCEQVLFV